MKFLAHCGAVLALVGGTFFVPSLPLLSPKVALALPEQQILEKLRPVPVFTIADNNGAPLVASPAQGQNSAPVAGVFISQKDAQAFLDQLRTRNPELAKNVRVVPVSLGEVYQLEQANRNKPDRLEFAFVPMQKQVEQAVALLKQSGQTAPQFSGVPLFIARGGTDKGYLTIQQGNQQVIPLFFKKEELQGLLDRFKQQQPALANTLDIQVVNLEGVLQTLRTSNNAQLGQLIFIPPQESLEFIRSLPQGGGQPAAPGRPAAAPSPSPSR